MVHVEDSEERIEEVLFQEKSYKFDFTQTGIDTNAFPFNMYRKIVNEVWQPYNNELLSRTPSREASLREEITNYLYESRGVRCSASQIVLGAGTQILVKLLFQLLKEAIMQWKTQGIIGKWSFLNREKRRFKCCL